jgi:ABC-type amino acid transport substrate-binding protein
LLPRRRVEVVLATGQDADLICNYHPAWLPGPLLWSESFLDSGDILVTALRHQPPPRRLLDLAGQRIGTTAGFHYPEMEAALGVDFIRDDAPNVVSSLAKLAAGRMDHALVGRVSFDYLRRRGQVPLEVHPPLMLSTVRTSCALSPRSSLHLADLNTAINQLRSDGGLTRILDQYR